MLKYLETLNILSIDTALLDSLSLNKANQHAGVIVNSLSLVPNTRGLYLEEL